MESVRLVSLEDAKRLLRLEPTIHRAVYRYTPLLEKVWVRFAEPQRGRGDVFLSDGEYRELREYCEKKLGRFVEFLSPEEEEERRARELREGAAADKDAEDLRPGLT